MLADLFLFCVGMTMAALAVAVVCAAGELLFFRLPVHLYRKFTNEERLP